MYVIISCGVLEMEGIDYTILGQNIAKRRKELNMSQENLAELIDVSRVYISSIESGHRKIYTSTLVRIANALRTTADALLLGQQDYDQGKYAAAEKSILASCSPKERRILMKTMNALRDALEEQ